MINYINKLLAKKSSISPSAGRIMANILMKLEKYTEANIILTDLIEQFTDNIQFMKNHNYSCQSIPQLLRTISSRQLLNSQSRGKYQKNWPTSSSFTLLNKTQMYKSTRPSTCASQKDNQSTFVTEN